MGYTQAQQKAINARGHNYVVSAGAGSGKTTVLSERVLKLLNDGVKINRMLILTFTNNAAANMKERIKKMMKKEPKFQDQIKLVDGADISTFDAYNQKLVRKYRAYLGIESDFSIAEGSYIAAIKRKIIEEIIEEKYALNDSDFLELLDRYTVGDDESIKNLIISIYDAISKTIDPFASLEKAKELAKNKSSVENAYKEVFNELSMYATKWKEELKNNVYTSLKAPEYVEKAINFIDTFVFAQDYDEFRKNFLISVNANLKPKINAKCDESEKIFFNILIENYYKKIKKICDSIPDINTYISIFDDEQKYKLIILNLAAELKNRLDNYKKINSYFEFDDIALMVLSLFRNYPDIALEVKNSYDEIMVDEYQDNSDLQESIINTLEKDNLFLVGDVKQSIYLFRNANPTLFIKRYEAYKNNNGGIAIDMNENFRSSPCVIDSVNNIFSDIMTLDFGGADYVKDHIIISSNPIYKNISGLKNRTLNYNCELSSQKPEIEATIIAKNIVSRINSNEQIENRNIKYSDFAVIMDRGNDFDTYVEVFNKYGIPIYVDNDQDVFNFSVIDVIINLFVLYNEIKNKTIDSNKFKHSLVSVARSFLFSTRDDVIYDAFKKGRYSDLESYNKVLEIVESTKELTVYEIYLKFIIDLDITSKIGTLANPSDSLTILEMYSNIVKGLSNIGISIDDFIDYLDVVKSNGIKLKMKFNNDSSNAVKLLNIHKSKGLEYNFCYFPGIYREYPEKDSKQQFLFSKKYGIALPLVDDESKESIFKYLIDKSIIFEGRSERIRTLYVALTRPKYSYDFVVCNNDIKIKPNIKEVKKSIDVLNVHSNLLSFVKVEDDIDIENSKKLVKEEYKDFGFEYKTLDVKNVEKEKVRASKKGKLTIDKGVMEFGTFVHSIAENIDFANPDYSYIKNEKLKEVAQNLVKNITSLGCLEGMCYHEYSFYLEETDTLGSIDLLIVLKDRAIIVDYKLKNISDEAYVNQLRVYSNAVEKIFSLKSECYLYSLYDGILQKINVEDKK